MSGEVPPEHLADEIWPQHAPEHAVPAEMPITNFKPWHLPRKQWIRRVQWFAQTRRLLKSLILNDRPLRYLGLPGSELLDIEVLAELCAENNVRLRYLGFNTGSVNLVEQTTQRLAENALKSWNVIDPGSIVTSDDILSLSSAKSLATKRLTDFDSFDVVNLDVCDAFTTAPGREMHQAVKNLLQYQINSRTHPWLLFVTTVIDRDAIAQGEVDAYREIFLSNARRSVSFRSVLQDLLETVMHFCRVIS